MSIATRRAVSCVRSRWSGLAVAPADSGFGRGDRPSCAPPAIVCSSSPTTRRPRVEAQEAALAAIGIPAVGDVLTSANAAALLIEPGERCWSAEARAWSQAVVGRGASVVGQRSDGRVDVVVVGFHRTFDYEEMLVASRAARNGARLIGTNDDATYPTPDGPIPGGGRDPGVDRHCVAALRRSSPASHTSRWRRWCGRPSATMQRRHAVMVGDRPETDGLMAATLGCRYAACRVRRHRARQPLSCRRPI